MSLIMVKSSPVGLSIKQNTLPKRAIIKTATAFLITIAVSACGQNTSVASAASQVQQSVSDDSTSSESNNTTTTTATEVVQPAHIEKYQQIIGHTYQQMADAIKTSDVNASFVKSMIVHHQGAVAMSYTQLKFGQDVQIREFAQGIIDLQQEEIAWMKDWLINHANQPAMTLQPDGEQDGMQEAMAKKAQSNHQEMMDDVTDTNPDVAYIKAMILHHKTAIKMANTAIDYGVDADVSALAEQIKIVHSQEIEQMKDWLKSHQ